MNEMQEGITARLTRQGHRDDAPVVQPSTKVAVPSHATGVRTALLGVGVSPGLAALLRAIVYVVLVGGGDAALMWLGHGSPVWLVPYSVIISGSIRQIEGLLDGYFKGTASAASPEG